MPERLFLFVQLEFPWALGPPDGRYLLRSSTDGEPERVVVLGTLSTRVAGPARRRRRPLPMRARRRGRVASSEPAPVASARATLVDPISVSAERQARAWLDELDAVREAEAAASVLNRVLYLQRIATADPYVREVSPEQALVIRAGWGEGEQVADGRWSYARELPLPSGGERRGRSARARRDRRGSAALRPQERLAELMSGRDAPLLCEELVLRARVDFDHGRLAHAAIGLDAAYAALAELRAEGRQDLALRLAELDKLAPGVHAQAQAASAASTASAASAASTAATSAASAANPASVDEDVVGHALERLESALRARTAAGFQR